MRILLSIKTLALLFALLFLISTSDFSYGSQDDINCLKSIKASLEDPFQYLNTSWDFNNNTEGFICRFTGVDCWHPNENKVLNIRLSDMGLKGVFPHGVANCTSLTGLDLSRNKISGSIPSNISELLKYVTVLDLSYNNLSGEIPADFANCSYLNVLHLDNNQLTGQIPAEIGSLVRLKTFSAANNQLTGPIPHFINASADDFVNNKGLCNGPLPRCRGPPKKSRMGVIIVAAIVGVTVAALLLGVAMFLLFRRVSRKKKEEDPEGNKWARSIKGAKGIELLMFERLVSKMRLNDLMKATNNFCKHNIIATGRTGTLYKAILADGTSLTVKRLQDTQHSEKEFVSEMTTLGNVKHRNLVPLLGFCLAKNEKLLIYKHMPNGTLNENLHTENVKHNMDWPLRLKIAIRASKGFAWLHHGCNPRIIHRNISSNCILLDSDYEPKISDFGLARLMNPVDTHLSTFVNGEFGDLGYVAPEYARTLVATPKGDVFSFGVVLLELVTGEHPTRLAKAPETFKGNLVEWVAKLSVESRLKESIDESLRGKGYDAEVFQFLKVACNCVASSPKERPTMFEVYQLLRAIGERYNFTTEDEIFVPLDSNDADHEVELIVARETKDHR